MCSQRIINVTIIKENAGRWGVPETKLVDLYQKYGQGWQESHSESFECHWHQLLNASSWWQKIHKSLDWNSFFKFLLHDGSLFKLFRREVSVRREEWSVCVIAWSLYLGGVNMLNYFDRGSVRGGWSGKPHQSQCSEAIKWGISDCGDSIRGGGITRRSCWSW